MFLIANEQAIENKILCGTINLINKVISKPETWLKTLINFFKKSNKRWNIGFRGLSVQLEPEEHKDIPDNILQALTLLEFILKKKKQKAILFIDEIQEIANVKQNISIEGAIRNLAQESEYLTIIFSGSNLHMLKHMFSDRNRPLYELCERIHLHRLSVETYQNYLEKIALKTWDKKLDINVFQKIMEFSERHPRTVYVLCARLWDKTINQNNPPSLKDINDVCDEYIKTKFKDIRVELESRSQGQIKLLTLIAEGNITELSGKSAQQKLNVSGSAIVQAIQKLENHGFIERYEKHRFRIIDPIIKHVLITYNT